LLFPNQVIRGDALARAMVSIAVEKTSERERRSWNHHVRRLLGPQFCGVAREGRCANLSW
jgi:hypothetical protein